MIFSEAYLWDIADRARGKKPGLLPYRYPVQPTAENTPCAHLGETIRQEDGRALTRPCVLPDT